MNIFQGMTQGRDVVEHRDGCLMDQIRYSMYVPGDCCGVGGASLPLVPENRSKNQFMKVLRRYAKMNTVRQSGVPVGFLGGWKLVFPYYRMEKSVLPCCLRTIINSSLHMNVPFISPPGVFRVHCEINAVLQ